MGFAKTAEYFAGRAERERGEGRRDEFLEAAQFYRRLAAIVDDFPAGYRPPDRLPGYQARAEECRAIADQMTDPVARQQMYAVADHYEGLARVA